ncbi:nitrilase-related carbon-nitrogen hydrolase [Sulfurimonas sp.]|uniref:nitrilase-related carbon-nitrogen hydrolase n=1 Tax=Sulfurimonas sp. TaxID=2022749 RepID=UPI00356A34C3
MRVTLAQISPKLNRTNLDDIISIVESNKEHSDIIVFPELALNGYLLQDKLYEDAWDIDELERLKSLSTDVDIVVGAAMRDGSFFRNAGLYFSKGELLSQHNKVHLPNYGMFEEARYFEAGDVFESFKSKFGKVSMIVCEDMWHENVHKGLKNENPDYVIALVASPARGFSDDGLAIEEKWYDILNKVSLECNAKVVFVNRVGFEDGLGFWGGSCLVDNHGKITEKLSLFKEEIKTFNI